MEFEIYLPPACACCDDRGEEYLYDKQRGMDEVIVCHICKGKILEVQRQTNQSWMRCIEALRNGELSVAQAVKWLDNQYSKRRK
jgi:hypothetical protein